MAIEAKAIQSSKLKNIILSSNPCPICIDAARQPAMIISKWKVSRFGLTDSKKRYCNLTAHNCHCILVPEQLIKEFPEIDRRIKLRGDPETDIKAIVEIGPNEDRLQALMDRYNFEIGKLPDEIYDMPLEDVADYLESLLRSGPGAPGGLPAPPGKPWKLSKDAAKAKEYAKKNLITEGGTVDFQKMSLEGINIMNKELSALIEKYGLRPDFVGTWKGFRKYAQELFGARWQFVKSQYKMPRNAWASYNEFYIGDKTFKGLVVRDEWWTDAGFLKMKEDLKKCVETGWHRYSTPEGIFHHEYSHLLDHTIGVTNREAFRERYLQLVRDGKIKESISGYAKGDFKGEAWAELFANYKDGYYKRTAQTGMQQWVEDIIKYIEGRT